MKARAEQVGDLNCTILQSRDTEKDGILLLLQLETPFSYCNKNVIGSLFMFIVTYYSTRKEKVSLLLLFSETVFLCVVVSVLKLSLWTKLALN